MEVGTEEDGGGACLGSCGVGRREEVFGQCSAVGASFQDPHFTSSRLTGETFSHWTEATSLPLPPSPLHPFTLLFSSHHSA